MAVIGGAGAEVALYSDSVIRCVRGQNTERPITALTNVVKRAATVVRRVFILLSLVYFREDDVVKKVICAC